MKFEKAKDVYIKKKVSGKGISKKEDFTYSRLHKWTIVNRISICVMKPEMKGHFNFMNQLINDGSSIMPWTIKITHINGFWSIYVGHNINLIPDVDYKIDTDYEITHFKNCFVVSKIEDKIEMQNYVNKMINIIRNSQLEVIETDNINIKYTCDSKSSPFEIADDYLYNNEFDEGTYKKFLMMLDKLDKASLKGRDKKIFHEIGLKLIRNKYLDKNDREVLNLIFRKNLNDKDRIKIAMKFL